ncbi:hypothetical protein OESDEN_06677 [Oesophagostomum dentatum]|uniref:Uncharacterized protein n=1 Tax=Oesophagostomum dentatum TaxID=61180 RepID=A0A0B1TB91_OESDE|nr:hypothetical protein OESDEN_06677 [Oesophagostomum dentatum]
MSAISRVVRTAACNAYPDEDKRCISKMHPPTLFLLSVLAGILASPAHRPSWRTRRGTFAPFTLECIALLPMFSIFCLLPAMASTVP